MRRLAPENQSAPILDPKFLFLSDLSNILGSFATWIKQNSDVIVLLDELLVKWMDPILVNSLSPILLLLLMLLLFLFLEKRKENDSIAITNFLTIIPFLSILFFPF